MSLIHRTQGNVDIITQRGSKSAYDFIVKYREPSKRERTPKHIHIIIDLYMKLASNHSLTMSLVDHIINNIINKVQANTAHPPTLQVYQPQHVQQFSALDQYGEYSVEFLLVTTELIMIQEKTNYPTGTMNLNLFRKFRQGVDIFSVVSAATFR